MLLRTEAASAWSGAPSMLAVTNPKADYRRAIAATADAQMGSFPLAQPAHLYSLIPR